MSKSKSKSTDRKTAYHHITEGILADLRQGVASWVKPWAAGPVKPHRNAVSGHQYSGINALLTMMAAAANGFTESRWLTKRQINELGGDFRGQSPTWITFVKPFKGKDEEEQDGKRKSRGGMYLKAYMIWNAQQVSGIELPAEEPVPAFTERVEEIEAFIASVGATIRHGGNRAAYHPTGDVITMPHPGTFEDAGSYYATMFHELVHFTGAEQRLARDFSGRFGSEAYAFEELVAELGAAFLCAEFGVPGRLQHSEYIGHWIKVLEGDEKAIVTAASQAQAAANYLRELAAGEELPAAA